MCKILSYMLVLLFLNVCHADGKYRYDYEYNKEAQGWLKLHQVPATFKEAFFRCDFEGAVLASPLDEGLTKALMEIQPKTKTKCGIYTGIHSTISHGDYTTVEGIPLPRLPVIWAENEPDNFEDQEHCLIMLQEGTLADVRCNETFPYACYKKKTKNLVITECGTIDPAYKLDKRTGSCYKFHRIGMTWKRAQMICLAEGGHLAIINSPTEAMALRDLFGSNAPDTIRGNYKDVMHLGFLDWSETGLWYTTQGQRLQDTGYTIWSSGQPDRTVLYGQPQFCGGMFRNGLLDDVWCDVLTMPFVCEKTPESLAVDDESQ